MTEKPESIEEKTSEEKIMETIVEEKVVEESKEKSINRILWGIIVVLVLIILFGAYWMFFRSEDTPEVTPAPPVQEELVETPAPIAEEKPQEETLKTVQFIELSEEELRKERVPSFGDTLDYQIVGTQTEHLSTAGRSLQSGLSSPRRARQVIPPDYLYPSLRSISSFCLFILSTSLTRAGVMSSQCLWHCIDFEYIRPMQKLLWVQPLQWFSSACILLTKSVSSSTARPIWIIGKPFSIAHVCGLAGKNVV